MDCKRRLKSNWRHILVLSNDKNPSATYELDEYGRHLQKFKKLPTRDIKSLCEEMTKPLPKIHFPIPVLGAQPSQKSPLTPYSPQFQAQIAINQSYKQAEPSQTELSLPSNGPLYSESSSQSADQQIEEFEEFDDFLNFPSFQDPFLDDSELFDTFEVTF